LTRKGMLRRREELWELSLLTLHVRAELLADPLFHGYLSRRSEWYKVGHFETSNAQTATNSRSGSGAFEDFFRFGISWLLFHCHAA
jgi:hypothetical protein